MAATIRLATEQDAEDTLAIYAPIVRSTPISFELEPPSVSEMRRRIADTLAYLPWLVCEDRGAMLGYAYASKHRVRAAYQWSVDVSVYVHAPARRAGVGRALYTSLLKMLILQGFYHALAGIALPNPASVGFHEALGFQLVGVYRAVGYKLGAWHDVGWWQLSLQEPSLPPDAPLPLKEVQGSAEWQAALAAGLACLQF
jgi:L-amino acid N-acyltransferase YncA